jgi:hypothetical protein
MNINPFALVSISVSVLIPSPLLLIVHGIIREWPPISLLKSNWHTSIPSNPRKETTSRARRFPTELHSFLGCVPSTVQLAEGIRSSYDQTADK